MSYDSCRKLAASALRHAGVPLPEGAENDKHAFHSEIMSLAIALSAYDRKDWDLADEDERDRVAWQLAAASLGFKQYTTEAAAALDEITDERWREEARMRLVQVISEEP